MKPGPVQAGRPARSKSYFDEDSGRRYPKAAPLQNERLAPMAEDFDEGIVRHAEPVETEGSIAVAVETTVRAKDPAPESTPAMGGLTAAPTLAPPEPRLEGLRAWFDHVMDRASQRFTLEARLVTVVLSCIFVFAAHFDAVRLFQSMSQGAELRARLAASAEAIDKQAEQFSRSKEGAHTVVPDVYRKVMASVLRTVAAAPEPPKPKVRAVSHTAPPSRNSQQWAGNGLSMALNEDKVTAEAKAKATHALEAVPGFASREDAESWLRTTLDGNPARESLAAAYQQEVNAELVSDSDKLIDESASLKSELVRSEFKLCPDGRDWMRSSNEVPGLLVTVAFLSLGATFWYNTLKNLASLRPQLAIRQDRERKHEKLG